MHPPHVRTEVLALVERGLNDCEIARRTGLSRTTIRDWRTEPYQRRFEPQACPRCWRAARPMFFTPAHYSELLAVYLGDGCISVGPRTACLRVMLDAKYPGIVADVQALVRQCFPSNKVGVVNRYEGRMATVYVYSSHLICLFPQHGAGKKHERPIRLEPWQRAQVEEAPWRFIRGCIQTDGCNFINRTDVHRPRPYEYLSYEFSNKSTDIVDLFVDSCERVGVYTRRTRNPSGLWQVRINRRESVALLLEHVGLKE
jgi:hypothetical protein